MLSVINKKEHRNEKLIFLITFFGNSFFNRAIWIIYFSSMGYSLGKIFTFQAIINFSMFMSEIPTGVIADKYGRKNSLIIGRVLIIMYLLIIILFSNNIIILILGFLLNGIGMSFISGSDEALLYDSLKENNRESDATMILGKYSACVTIALAIGMGVGGILQKISWNTVYITTIVFQLISLLIAMFLEESTHIEKNNISKSAEDSIFKSLLDQLKSFLKLDKELKVIAIGIAIYSGFISTYYMFSQEIFYKNDYTVLLISFIYAIENIISAIVNSNSYRIERKFNNSTILKLILISTVLAITLLFFNIKLFTIITFFTISITCSVFTPIIYSLINKNIESRNRASILSIISFFTTLIMFIMFSVLGATSEIIDSSIVIAILGITSVVITLFSVWKNTYIK